MLPKEISMMNQSRGDHKRLKDFAILKHFEGQPKESYKTVAQDAAKNISVVHESIQGVTTQTG